MHTEKGTSELEELRSRLLDLTLKNNLLNYKSAPGRSINIVCTNPENIYKTLVLDEKGMKFYPAGKDTTSGAEERKIWKYPAFSKTEKYEELILNTPYSDIELRKRLYALQAKSRTVFEEQGYPVLYLAVGFIQWTEKENQSRYFKAPLILIPVELERQKVKENYTLKWTGDDPVVSPSLVVKLAEQGVVIKDLVTHETAEDVAAYFDSVAEAVIAKEWTFIPDVTLDLFSFRKFVMYKDLDPESWKEENPFETNTLIKNIFRPEAAEIQTEKILENELDDRLPSERSYNIMDADSSQIAVIEEAKSGKNLVVEGPPGTGKSQTIANLIAELLEMGKTVLFVSEKMAALEVVKRRLDNAGLSRFCLELHSQKAKKAELIRELEKCTQHPDSEGIDSKDCHFQINALRNELSGYCKELKEPIGQCGFTPYDLFG
ncbi:MAG: DUF4011 domain-containing protein, partial [Methanocorpusculum sp.]|nr:DUF4011 domain-containing protein [Methanocorpusculum sp.]